MKRLFTWLKIAFLALAMGQSFLLSQENRFSLDASKLKIGTAYHFEKSNIDGTHKSRITLYIADKEKLESFKKGKNDLIGTLVIAEMDWTIFSVKRFENWQVGASGKRILRGYANFTRLKDDRLKLDIAFGDMKMDHSISIGLWPWHSYDFDFNSLNVCFPHLVDPEKSFSISVADIIPAEHGMEFKDKGTVQIDFLKEELRYGISARKYRIDGPGLENRGGILWVSKTEGHLIDYEIDLPDEQSLKSGKLRLIKIETLSKEEWQNFIRNQFD